MVLELKTLAEISEAHIVQTNNYTVAYDLSQGSLLNFGSKSLESKLVIDHEYNSLNANSI